MKNENNLIDEKPYFLFKVFSKNNNHDFSVKNLLSSFNLELFFILKDFKILVNPIKKSSPIYIESIEKKIEKNFLWIFKKEKVISNYIDFKTKLLKIFHVYLKIPTYYAMENSSYQQLNLNKTTWRLNSLQLDYIIISKVGENVINKFSNKKIKFSDYGKNFKYNENDKRKKIRIDYLNLLYNLILFNNYELSRKNEKNKKSRKPIIKSLLIVEKTNSVYKSGFILVEKYTGEKFIILIIIKENIQILSLKNQKISFECKEIKIRFDILEETSFNQDCFYDKDGKKLIKGSNCHITNGKFKGATCFVLYHSKGILFVSLMEDQNYEKKIIITFTNFLRLNINQSCDKIFYSNEYSNFVTITKGQFKGYKCKVLNIEDNFLEVIILSVSKIIKISKKNVYFLNFPEQSSPITSIEFDKPARFI